MHEASLVHITPEAESFVAYTARVSNPLNQNNKTTAPKLIGYLIKHKHWSPFEMVSMCLEINTTRSIAAQILRHRSFSFQEFSQRYSNVEALGRPEVPELRSQDFNNRQNSIDNLPQDTRENLHGQIQDLYDSSFKLYELMLSKNVAKECARDILPLASPSRLYMHGNIRSWITYIALREKNGTQLEHRNIALSCKKIFAEQLPMITEALGGSDADWII